MPLGEGGQASGNESTQRARRRKPRKSRGTGLRVRTGWYVLFEPSFVDE